MPLGENGSNCREGIFFIQPQVLDGSGKNGFRYDGSASGRMLYNWHRDYNPALGRYVQSDPVGLQAGINTFSYVEGVPTLLIDPTGQGQKGAAIGGAIGAGLGAWGGAIVGGAAGAAGGTLVLPGVGTVSVGALGGVEGAAIGGSGGLVVGAAVGNAVEDAMDYISNLASGDDPNGMFAKGGKSQGRNWATEQAKSAAQGSGKDPCDILAEMLANAKAAGDTSKAADITQAQKFMDCRNKDKRKNKYRCGG